MIILVQVGSKVCVWECVCVRVRVCVCVCVYVCVCVCVCDKTRLTLDCCYLQSGGGNLNLDICRPREWRGEVEN